jgi:photosystem II stability/assembly factor-like uncharacterized protein
MKKLVFLFIILIYSLSLAQWQTNGPQGGIVNCFANLGSYLFAGTETRGIFRSADGGASWSAIGQELSSSKINAITVSSPKLYAGTSNGIFISSNNGLNWTSINSGLTNTNILSLASNGTNVFAGTLDGGIFLSTNEGITWTAVNSGLTNLKINALITISSNIYAGTDGGIFLSTNNGSNWIAVNSGITNFFVNSFSLSGAYLFAGTKGGVFQSTNNGTSWIAANSGLTSNDIRGFTVSSVNLFVGTNGGVFLSTDYGNSWIKKDTGLTDPSIKAITIYGSKIVTATEGKGIYISTNNGSSWFPSNIGLHAHLVSGICGNNYGVFTSTFDGGVYSSTDNGLNWITSDSGITIKKVNAISITDSNVFAGTDIGIFKSTDLGVFWTVSNIGLTNLNIKSILATGNNIFAGTKGGGVFISTDYGQNWFPANYGITNDTVQALAISGSIIYAGTSGSGIFKTTNNGSNWFPINNGLTDLNIKAITTSGSNIFVGTPTNGVFISTNKGLSWSAVNTGLNSQTVNALTSSGPTVFAGLNTGVFVTVNNGKNWNAINEGLSNPNINTLFATGTKIFAGNASSVWNRSLLEFIPSLTVTSANGNEIWMVNSTKSITWNSYLSSSVKIEYSTNNGLNWLSVINSTPSTGSYNWTIPNTPSSLCRIKITDLDNSSVFDSSDNTFTIKLSSIAVTSPNGGELWKVGTSHNITWTSDSVTTIKIDYSTDNGLSWQTITNSTAASIGSYNWTIPFTPSAQCKVRLIDNSIPIVIDSSNNVFTIYNPNLSLTSPNGGENWLVQTFRNITWTKSYVNNIKLEYTSNNGLNWILINNNVPADSGKYLWNIPNTPSSFCKVKITDVADSSVADTSNNTFSINLPVVNVTSPNGGEYWRNSTTQNITWLSNNVSNVKIEYSTDNGTNWLLIISSFPDSSKNFNWLIPNTPSTNCKLRITDVANSNFSDTSDNKFTIYNPNLKVNSPNGGETWTAKYSFPITWISNDVVKVNLEYSTNSGSSWIVIDTGIVASNQTYSWLIPAVSSTNCKVRVYDKSLPIVGDTSDNTFTIILPTISLLSPNGGENWRAGKNYNITWISSNITNVKIEFTTNNGISWSTVSNSTPASGGVYSWTVPNISAPVSKIKIADASNALLADTSDNSFNIFIPSITVTSPNGGEQWISGSQRNITWTKSFTGNIRIEYTTNNGLSWSLIVDNFVSDSLKYIWLVPNTPSSLCKIKITEAADSSIQDLSNNTFSILMPNLLITSPNGGEEWRVGTTKNITWINNNVVNVRIQYSTNFGTSWITIASSVPASNGTYSWIIPNTRSSRCIVKISDISNPVYTDSSDTTFTIYFPEINVTSPNGGESWLAYKTKSITWNSSFINNIAIDFSSNYGLSWTNIASSVNAKLGYYYWNLPFAESDECIVRVYDNVETALVDASDNSFTIYPPSVLLASPNGGENWRTGTLQTIIWANNHLEKIRLEYSSNNGATWNLIVDSLAGDNERYTWMIPNLSSTQCKVRIFDIAHNNIGDTSNNTFSIFYPDIQLQTPNGGEKFFVGQSKPITWTSTFVNYVRLEYTTNNGIAWNIITTSISALSGNYNWKLPSISSKQYKIKVSDLNNPGTFDISDSSFSVEIVPMKLLLSLYQNPVLTQYCNLVVTADSILKQAPEVKIWRTTDTNRVVMQNIANSNYSYKGEYKFGSSGTYSLYTKVTSSLGYEKDTIKYYSIVLAKPKTLSKVISLDSLAALQITPDILNEETYFVAEDEKLNDEDIYIFGPNTEFHNKLTLEIKYDESKFPDVSKLFIYKYEDNKWHSIRSQVLLEKKIIRSYINSLGKFKIGYDASFNGNNVVPTKFVLYQNYPNPFNPSTNIRYDLPFDGRVSLIIYNVIGEVVSELVNENNLAGIYEVEFKLNDLPSGIYFYSLNAHSIDGQNSLMGVKKMMLLK